MMEITIVRSGGFAGVHEKLGPVDTSKLPGDTGPRIESKVREVGFFELPGHIPEGQRHSTEPFDYVVTIQDGERQHTVRYDDNSDHEAVLALAGLRRLLEESGASFKAVPFELAATANPDGFSWTAWYNRMPGIDDPKLHVSGTRTFGDSGVQLSLRRGNVGVVPEPGLVALDLTITRPQSGDDVQTEKRVDWSEEVGSEIDRVRIQGDAQQEIEVIIAV
jgi:hypothetical protein